MRQRITDHSGGSADAHGDSTRDFKAKIANADLDRSDCYRPRRPGRGDSGSVESGPGRFKPKQRFECSRSSYGHSTSVDLDANTQTQCDSVSHPGAIGAPRTNRD